MVMIDVRIAEGVNEFARFQVANLRHHHRKKSIGCNVEWDTKKYVRRALIKLAGQFSIRYIELEKAVTRRQGHLIDQCRIPSRYNQTTGIWIGFDVMSGVALAAGGFVMAATAYIFGIERFKPLVRPAILTGLLGYLLVIGGLMVDLGRPYNVWRPLIHWQHHSVAVSVTRKLRSSLLSFRDMLATAIAHRGAAAVRIPRGEGLGVSMRKEFTILPIGKAELIRDGKDVALFAIGNMVPVAETAADLLRSVYGISKASVTVVPHGVPVVPFDRDRSHRESLGLAARKVICTFGLINPGKGLELMIRAMPQIVAEFPDAIYSIVGVTHPQVKRQTGEVYREQLVALAASLGVSRNVQFVNQYLSLPALIAYLQSSDVFVTPYPGKDQIASGTMAYAMAAVGAIVSTPYLYAKEVLAEGRGLLVPFSSSDALADATLRFLKEPNLVAETRRRAYDYAKSMFWPHVGQQYLKTFSQVAASNPAPSRPASRLPIRAANAALTQTLLKK